MPLKLKYKNLEVSVLNKISHVIIRRRKISELLTEVLNILYAEMGYEHGTITLRRGNTLFIESSHGLSQVEAERGKYLLGEGVTGKVALSGESRIIPDIAHDPEFLNRTRARKKGDDHIAFICVPVINNEEVIGTISIDRLLTSDVDLERDCALLETVANLTAAAIAASLLEHEEREKLLAENQQLKLALSQSRGPASLIGSSNAMQQVYNMIEQVARSNVTVLVRGSSGTGKELVARAIHAGSSRRNAPMIVVNCAALPENLIESELFGHEKGAFTGAVSQRIGMVEAAHSGTIFLDEIGDLGQPMQVKLLRFIQERTFYRIGSNEEHKVDVRILAATSRNLEQLMLEGKFREDLYYRLNVFPIKLPDLCERKSDIIVLAEYFLRKFSSMHQRQVKRLSTPALNLMLSYRWPGNVRELENCMERAVLTASGEVIHGYDLPPALNSQNLPVARMDSLENSDIGGNLETLVAEFERNLIEEALKSERGNMAAAARRLGSSARIIRYKIAKLGIQTD